MHSFRQRRISAGLTPAARTKFIRGAVHWSAAWPQGSRVMSKVRLIHLNELLQLVLEYIDFAEAQLFIQLRRRFSNKQLTGLSARVHEFMLTNAM
jgi:hypothetical protein